MDHFLNSKNTVNRLIYEYNTHKSIIVAYDFDNTVYDYHNKGFKYDDVINLIRECKREGFHLVVFTSCNDDRMEFIKNYLVENNIPFDYINETPDFIPFKGRKIYYNILPDDRAGLSSAYEDLWKLIYDIRGKRNTSNLTELG